MPPTIAGRTVELHLLFKMISYGSLVSSGRKSKASYSPLREADAEVETASSRHTFSLVPVAIAFIITGLLIYIIVLVKYARGSDNLPTIHHHGPSSSSTEPNTTNNRGQP